MAGRRVAVRGLLWMSAFALVAGCAANRPAAPAALVLYDGQPGAGLRVQIASQDGEKDMKSGSAEVAANPPATTVQALVRTSGKERDADALTMRWDGTWFASLRFVADKPVDLRAYVPHGAIELDVEVLDMAKAGLSFAMGCGPGCVRKVSYVLPSRALQGAGWAHVSVPLRCFERDGNDFSTVTQPFSVESGGTGQVALANVRIVAQARSDFACPDYRVESVTPQPLAEPWALDWWIPRHEEKLQEIRTRKAAGVQTQLVFIGDSITQGWEGAGRPVWDEYYQPYHALDLGFGGDRTENVLWRLQHGEVDGLAPKVVVLMVGTNNAGHRHEDPATTAAGVRRLVDELRQRLPDAKVLLLAVFPRDERPGADLRKVNDQVNARIAGLDDGRHVFFLDIGKDLAGPDGTLSRSVMPDLLHPNETGYRIWARSMQPTLKKLLKP